MLSHTQILVMIVIYGSEPPGVYGLDIIRAFKECCYGDVHMSVGTLYSTLKKLRDHDPVLLKSTSGKAISGGAERQYYELTDTGNHIIEDYLMMVKTLRYWKP